VPDQYGFCTAHAATALIEAGAAAFVHPRSVYCGDEHVLAPRARGRVP